MIFERGMVEGVPNESTWGRRASAATIVLAASLLGGTCQRPQTAITVTPTLANPGVLQIAGQGFAGANGNGHCAQLAVFGLGPPGVLSLGQPNCTGGSFNYTWTYGDGTATQCAPATVVVTAVGTDPANPFQASQASQVLICGAVCGDVGLPACAEPLPSCYSGTLVGGTCQCGDRNDACCNGDGCSAPNVCINGTCQCGALDQPCCAGSGGCGSNLTCWSNPGSTPYCSCGMLTGPCCQGVSPSCQTGAVCFENSNCERCGGQNDPCCDGNECSPGYTCDNGYCKCGGLNEACCGGTSCLRNGSGPLPICSNNVCIAPGAPSGPACGQVGASCGTGAACCPGNLVCNYNHRATCVAHGATCTEESICCDGDKGDMCVSNSNLSGQFVCDVPDGPPCGPGYPAPCPVCLPGYPLPCPQTTGPNIKKRAIPHKVRGQR